MIARQLDGKVALVTGAGGTMGRAVVRALVEVGAKPSARVQGTPPLTLAVSANCEETVRFLLKSGADVNAADDQGMTALMQAAGWGHASMVQLLLENGADPEARNKQGQTAWGLAAVGQHQEVAEIFRKARESKPK